MHVDDGSGEDVDVIGDNACSSQASFFSYFIIKLMQPRGGVKMMFCKYLVSLMLSAVFASL